MKNKYIYNRELTKILNEFNKGIYRENTHPFYAKFIKEELNDPNFFKKPLKLFSIYTNGDWHFLDEENFNLYKNETILNIINDSPPLTTDEVMKLAALIINNLEISILEISQIRKINKILN